MLARNYFEDPFAFMGNLTYILTDPRRRELFLDPPFYRPGYALEITNSVRKNAGLGKN